jgi:hypothetical protein
LDQEVAIICFTSPRKIKCSATRLNRNKKSALSYEIIAPWKLEKKVRSFSNFSLAKNLLLCYSFNLLCKFMTRQFHYMKKITQFSGMNNLVPLPVFMFLRYNKSTVFRWKGKCIYMHRKISMIFCYATTVSAFLYCTLFRYKDGY